MPSAVEVFYDASHYRYVRVSREWAKMCSVLPCFDRIRWPDYAAKAIETKIDGIDVVIQLWKGWCPRFLGNAHMPGGIGGEVGIYRRIEREEAAGRDRAHELAPVQKGVVAARQTIQHAAHVIKPTAFHAANHVASNPRLWWPAPELHANLQFELSWRGRVFFRTDLLRDTYWLTQWMDKDDFSRYRESHDTPAFAWNFTQRYWINGHLQPDWVGHGH